VTTGAFAGKVKDVDGNAVMGAEITIVHVPTGTTSRGPLHCHSEL
jgi:hypothetical protein